MAPTVTTVLDRALGSPRTYSVGRVWKLTRNLVRFQTEPEASSSAAGGPHSGRIPDSRRRP